MIPNFKKIPIHLHGIGHELFYLICVFFLYPDKLFAELKLHLSVKMWPKIASEAKMITLHKLRKVNNILLSSMSIYSFNCHFYLVVMAQQFAVAWLFFLPCDYSGKTNKILPIAMEQRQQQHISIVYFVILRRGYLHIFSAA